eukprot:5489855-Prymnesium_polylepis.1
MYENEDDVGAAIRASGKDRADVFIVSKLRPEDHGRDACRAAIDLTLTKLGVEQLDLWLMHTPSGGSVLETWQAMLEARDAGKVRAVGVSNFGAAQLEGLKAAGVETPEVNQIELHCWLQQRAVAEYCAGEGIVLMAFCPLARCKQFGRTRLAEMAAARGRTEAELAIRWLMQTGYVTIPKSASPARIVKNAVFDLELSAREMEEMAALDCGFASSNAVRGMDIPWETVA